MGIYSKASKFALSDILHYSAMVSNMSTEPAKNISGEVRLPSSFEPMHHNLSMLQNLSRESC